MLTVNQCFNNSFTTYIQPNQDKKHKQVRHSFLTLPPGLSLTQLLFQSSHSIICLLSLPCVILFCGTGHSHAHKYTYMTSSLAHSLLVSPCTCHAFAQFAIPSGYINIESARSLSLSLFHPTHSQAIVLHQHRVWLRPDPASTFTLSTCHRGTQPALN